MEEDPVLSITESKASHKVLQAGEQGHLALSGIRRRQALLVAALQGVGSCSLSPSQGQPAPGPTCPQHSAARLAAASQVGHRPPNLGLYPALGAAHQNKRKEHNQTT